MHDFMRSTTKCYNDWNIRPNNLSKISPWSHTKAFLCSLWEEKTGVTGKNPPVRRPSDQTLWSPTGDLTRAVLVRDQIINHRASQNNILCFRQIPWQQTAFVLEIKAEFILILGRYETRWNMFILSNHIDISFLIESIANRVREKRPVLSC